MKIYSRLCRLGFWKLVNFSKIRYSKFNFFKQWFLFFFYAWGFRKHETHFFLHSSPRSECFAGGFVKHKNNILSVVITVAAQWVFRWGLCDREILSPCLFVCGLHVPQPANKRERERERDLVYKLNGVSLLLSRHKIKNTMQDCSGLCHTVHITMRKGKKPLHHKRNLQNQVCSISLLKVGEHGFAHPVAGDPVENLTG